MNEIKIEKRVTEEDIRKAMLNCEGDILDGEAWDLICKWQLQELKDQQAKEVEFEIIQPKLLK